MRLSEREIHGATPMAGNKNSPMYVRETDDRVIIQEGYTEKLNLGAPAARFLARKINRVALRIEKRAAASAIEARSDATGTGAAEGESAGPQDDANA